MRRAGTEPALTQQRIPGVADMEILQACRVLVVSVLQATLALRRIRIDRAIPPAEAVRHIAIGDPSRLRGREPGRSVTSQQLLPVGVRGNQPGLAPAPVQGPGQGTLAPQDLEVAPGQAIELEGVQIGAAGLQRDRQDFQEHPRGPNAFREETVQIEEFFHDAGPRNTEIEGAGWFLGESGRRVSGQGESPERCAEPRARSNGRSAQQPSAGKGSDRVAVFRIMYQGLPRRDHADQRQLSADEQRHSPGQSGASASGGARRAFGHRGVPIDLGGDAPPWVSQRTSCHSTAPKLLAIPPIPPARKLVP